METKTRKQYDPEFKRNGPSVYVDLAFDQD